MHYLLDALLRLFMSAKDRRRTQSPNLRPRLQVETAYSPTDKLVRENGARRPINECHRSFSRLVSSGVFVGGLCHLSLLVIRCTWTSTPMPTFLSQTSSTRVRSQEDSEYERTHISQAACKHRKAIFGPKPGSEQSSSTVFGISESNSSQARRRCAARRIYLGFTFFYPSSTRKTRGRCGD